MWYVVDPDGSVLMTTFAKSQKVANLRRDPSRNAPVVQRLKKGTPLEATRLRGDWLQVRAGEASGWIARALVE